MPAIHYDRALEVFQREEDLFLEAMMWWGFDEARYLAACDRAGYLESYDSCRGHDPYELDL